MEHSDYCLVSILDTVSETSMPLNEFVLYRLKKYPSIKQYIIVCDSSENTRMDLPSELGVFYVEHNTGKIKDALKRIRQECSAEKIIVHLHQIKSALFFYKAVLFSKKFFKTLFTVHSVYALRNCKYKISSTVLALVSDRTTCVSEASYKSYSPIAKLFKREKICAVQNGVDIERIDKALNFEKPKEKDSRVLIYVGRLIPIKNQKFLVELFSRFNDCKMIFVGAENENREISKLIKQKGLDSRIQITGMLPRNKVFELLHNADIYVSSSTVEGLPVSVLEAMYAGLPVILSDIEPHRELAEKIDAVKIIGLDNKDGWAETVNNYLAMDSEELHNIGRLCRNGAAQNFSLDSMHKKYDKIYCELIKTQ